MRVSRHVEHSLVQGSFVLYMGSLLRKNEFHIIHELIEHETVSVLHPIDIKDQLFDRTETHNISFIIFIILVTKTGVK